MAESTAVSLSPYQYKELITLITKFKSGLQEGGLNDTKSYEIVGVHGYDQTRSSYLISLYWQEYQLLDGNTINWVREGYGVAGYQTINDVQQKICERVNGNAKREATCFKEYKNLTKYKHSAEIKLPIPESWSFDKNTILAEINLKENANVSRLFE
jgi:hypothetical protein